MGGNALKLIDTWQGEDVSENLREMINSVENHSLIKVYTGSSIKETEGFVVVDSIVTLAPVPLCTSANGQAFGLRARVRG